MIITASIVSYKIQNEWTFMSDKFLFSGLRFHHMGIPTDTVRPGERYSERFRMYTSDNKGSLRIQFHRFEKDCPLHALIKSLPHVALQVEDLLKSIEGRKVIFGPYEPIPDYKVAIIDDAGVPVELIETDLTDDELWGLANEQKDINL